MSDNARLIDECENLLEKNELREVYDKLNVIKDMDVELMSIFARTVRFMVNSNCAKNKKEKELWIERGVEVLKEGVEKYPNDCLSNTWYGIMLNVKSKEAGVNERIKLGYEIRDYFEKGLKANPQSYIANHCMGSWCYEVSSLSKIARAFASTFFSSPPSSSFEEALEYFKAAQSADSSNMLNMCRLAQCYDKLGKISEAKEWALKAISLPARDFEMEEALNECKHIAAKKG
ncbi:unnamed protein product [Rodentolepis nana]|uniref:Regulator of microtubule dynamics protein 1 n=1 Tax=Rodentolepis nana TaxID=102285 RepID=A0A0R3T7D7_RODNA|nr:unnamed protein product [Rodentolepis nana]